jgi:hypothetical protein
MRVLALFTTALVILVAGIVVATVPPKLSDIELVGNQCCMVDDRTPICPGVTWATGETRLYTAVSDRGGRIYFAARNLDEPRLVRCARFVPWSGVSDSVVQY